MSLVEEIKKIHPSDFMVSVGAFLGSIAPGFLTIGYFKPAALSDLDIFKLLVFSASLSLPVVIINSISAHSNLNEKMRSNKRFIIFCGFFFSFVVFYVALLISYFLSLSFKWYLVILFIIQTLLIYLLPKVLKKINESRA